MKRIALCLVFAAATTVPLVRAAAQSGDTGEAAKVDKAVEDDDGMIAWKWANFAVLMAALLWAGMKFGKPYFTAQTEAINQGLDEARRHREDAERRSADVRMKLANIGDDIERFRRTALAEQAAEMERQRQRMTAEVEATWANSSQQIETLGKHARLDLRRFASSLALELAEQRIRQRMNPAIQATLASDFVEKLKA
jgi:F0F1-type ATP synthase membrane subunit b/b'